jgi:hypothetical protein
MDQKPSKYIQMYFLGRVDPIANFHNNQDEAVECLKFLNKRIVIKSGSPINNKSLLSQPFYYLTGNSIENEFVEFVDMADVDVTACRPKLLKRILEKDGQRALPVVNWAPPDDMLPPYPDGTRNRKRRK